MAPNQTHTKSLRADSLWLGMLMILGTTVLQRLLGLLRGVLFCRYMDDHALGRWAIAFGFLTMVTPMLLLGLPGSMGRFVERFRRQAMLAPYLRGVIGIAGIAVLVTALMLCWFPDRLSGVIFGEQLTAEIPVALGLALISVVIMNFVNDLLGALRQIRTVSRIQFIFSIVFTVGGTLWLGMGGGLAGLILIYGVSALCGALPGIVVLAQHREIWNRSTTKESRLRVEDASDQRLWRRVIPFAASVWTMNLLVNAFELTDRYMLLYFCPGGIDAGQSAVGQFHSSRMLPLLVMSLATLLSGIVMPYLSADWESGQRRKVAYRCKQYLLAVSALFTLLGAAGVWIAPWLFNTVMSGKYNDGLGVLPATFALCTWSALALLAQNYLWCAERGRSISVSLLIALTFNVVMNAVLVPRFGLAGAVAATAMANLLLLMVMWWTLFRAGFPLDWSAAWTTLLPGTLLAGPFLSVVAVSAVILVSPHARHWLGQLGNALVRYNNARQARIQTS